MFKPITPNWPAPKTIKAYSTTRKGGFSEGIYASLNLGLHVDDDLDTVKRNRSLLQTELHLPTEPVWINQVHGIYVLQADQTSSLSDKTADASYTRQSNIVCTVLTADCLPILLCDHNASCVAAIHAGWRGLAAGVIEQTIKTMHIPGSELLAWLGPAIGPEAFEVGDEVKQQFCAVDPAAECTFKPSKNNRWLADIYSLAKQRLVQCGVTAVYGGEYCTYSDTERFFSYRRDGKTGRMASMIWIENSV